MSEHICTVGLGGVGFAVTGSLRHLTDNCRRAELELVDALNQAQSKYAEALRRVGVAPEAVELIQSWVNVAATTRAAMQSLRVQRALERSELLRQDATEALSAAELGQALGGLSDETVRLRERDGELFSILRPGRKRGREYPVFQTWAGIHGEPLSTVLEALGKPDGAAAYAFFTSASEGLGGLTPIEALMGVSHSADLGDDARAFLAKDDHVRLAAVVEAANDHAATLDA